MRELRAGVEAELRLGERRAVAFPYDRVYGRPKETVEKTTVAVPASVEAIRSMTIDRRHARSSMNR
jgi:hypothetical protein